jgi:hypothetical protein
VKGAVLPALLCTASTNQQIGINIQQLLLRLSLKADCQQYNSLLLGVSE